MSGSSDKMFRRMTGTSHPLSLDAAPTKAASEALYSYDYGTLEYRSGAAPAWGGTTFFSFDLNGHQWRNVTLEVEYGTLAESSATGNYYMYPSGMEDCIEKAWLEYKGKVTWEASPEILRLLHYIQDAHLDAWEAHERDHRYHALPQPVHYELASNGSVVTIAADVASDAINTNPLSRGYETDASGTNRSIRVKYDLRMPFGKTRKIVDGRIEEAPVPIDFFDANPRLYVKWRPWNEVVQSADTSCNPALITAPTISAKLVMQIVNVDPRIQDQHKAQFTSGVSYYHYTWQQSTHPNLAEGATGVAKTYKIDVNEFDLYTVMFVVMAREQANLAKSSAPSGNVLVNPVYDNYYPISSVKLIRDGAVLTGANFTMDYHNMQWVADSVNGLVPLSRRPKNLFILPHTMDLRIPASAGQPMDPINVNRLTFEVTCPPRSSGSTVPEMQVDIFAICTCAVDFSGNGIMRAAGSRLP
jgi:hypothetical protein